MTVKMIIATDCNFGIGKDNKLPWDCQEDLKYFKEQTLDDVVVMGRKTYESLPTFPKGLHRRYNYVVTSKSNGPQDNGTVSMGLSSIVKCLESGESIFNHKYTWIIGGASIYKELLPYVEEIHHTVIDGIYDCDTFFDMSFLNDWVLHESFGLSENAVVNIWRKNV